MKVKWREANHVDSANALYRRVQLMSEDLVQSVLLRGDILDHLGERLGILTRVPAVASIGDHIL